MDKVSSYNSFESFESNRPNDSNDSYFNTFTRADRIARKLNTSLSPHLIELLYSKNTTNIKNVYEKELKAFLGQYWPRALTLDYKCVLLDSSFENGLPHTRNSTLVFPNNEEISFKTYLHEFVHVYQRARPDDVLELICNLWKYNKVVLIDNSLRTSLNIRLNPDTDSVLYEDEDGSIHLTMYTKMNPTSLRDTMTVSLDSMRQVSTIESIQDVRKDHPFEMMAYMIADMADMLEDDDMSHKSKYKYNRVKVDLCKSWMKRDQIIHR